MDYKGNQEDHHSVTYDVLQMYYVIRGFNNVELYEEGYIAGGTYRVDYINVRRGESLEKDGILVCDEEIVVGEVKPPDEYANYDAVQKLAETAMCTRRMIAEKKTVIIDKGNGSQEKEEIKAEKTSEVCGVLVCHKFSKKLKRMVMAQTGFSFEKTSNGIYTLSGTFLGLRLRVVKISELEGESTLFFRMLGRKVTEDDVREYDRQVKKLLEKAPGMLECCDRVTRYSRKYNKKAFESYERKLKEQKEEGMGYYSEVRKEAYEEAYEAAYKKASEETYEAAYKKASEETYEAVYKKASEEAYEAMYKKASKEAYEAAYKTVSEEFEEWMERVENELKRIMDAGRHQMPIEEALSLLETAKGSKVKA